jgi:parallel beta-helix repeat protein
MRSISMICVLSFLLLSVSMFFGNIESVKSNISIVTVPDYYPTIQQAINNANAGDTIFVKNGTYYENVVLNKTLSLIGESKEKTIIDANKNGQALLVTASNTTVTGFTFTGSGAEWEGSWWDSAILLNDCNDTLIQESNFQKNWCGLWLHNATNNTIVRNSFEFNEQRAIAIDASSESNYLAENKITNNSEGIYIGSSPNNNLANNTMTGNEFNFGVFGETHEDFTQEVDTSNTVDGKPIYYWVNRTGATVPSNAGYVAVVDSRDITVEKLSLSHNDQGILLAYSSNTLVEGNKLEENVYGINLVGEAKSTIKLNNATGNAYGIGFRYSSNNILTENTFFNNIRGILLIYSSDNNSITKNQLTQNQYGIEFTAANYNLVTQNNITTSSHGIVIDSSFNNTVYRNNLINNVQQVQMYTQSANTWDNDYPSGGNYWSDYNGTDIYSGSYQNETGSDGIGDSPYTIDTNNTDRYPLMQFHVLLLGDLNQDRKVDLLDAIQAASSFGSSVGQPRWNMETDLNQDKIIDIFDLIILARNFGKHSS